ncbi:MAG TPA: carboxypeptidase regulatory-like domain-containing protein [Nitrospiraceae bacterium]|nr:carboxypeptidase regulatory-like domain-containing protein [Nitrospiraceae bacterium]
MRNLVLAAGLAAVVAVPVPPAWSYEEIAVTDGGAIAGKVTIVGGKPTPKGFNLVTFPDPVYCGRISTGTGWRILDDFVIAQDGGLKDVVVMLVDVPRGKPFTFVPPTIEARDCRFLPFVSIVRDHQEVVIMNMDPVMHDIQAYETSHLGPRVLFNSPLPMNAHHSRNVGADSHEHLAGEPMKEVIHLTKGRRIFVMQCGFHAYMESWGLAVENPYYAVTGQDGTFSIPDVPAGEYLLVAWHPQEGAMLEQKVTVPTKKTVAANFEFKAPQGRRSVHEMMDNPHYGLAALGKPLEILPTLELQKP